MPEEQRRICYCILNYCALTFYSQYIGSGGESWNDKAGKEKSTPTGFYVKSQTMLSKTAQMFNEPLLLMLLKSIHRIIEYLRGQQRIKGTMLPYPSQLLPCFLSANVHKPIKVSESRLHTLPTTPFSLKLGV